MKYVIRTVLGCALLPFVAAAGGAEIACVDGAPLASSVRLEYAIAATARSILTLRGDGAVVFRRSGDTYTMESSLQALGIFEAHQSSIGAIRPTGLVPRSFTQRTSRRPPRSVSFDWAAKRVTFSQNGESAPTRPQMQDRLSLLMQLSWRHRNEPGVREIELPVAGLKHESDYHFTSQGVQTVAVPGGRFETVKFDRRKEDGDDALEVWLAPSLCSLPVRLRFSDDKGLVVDQQLRAIQPL